MEASQEVEVRLSHAYDADERDVDMAVKVLATAHDKQEITQEEMDAVRWKIDWHMVPMLFVCLQLSGWDKVVSHLQHEGGSGAGRQPVELGGLDHIFCLPHRYLPDVISAPTLPTSKYLAVNIFLWGVVEMCHSCSAALWVMVERFPAAKGKRDAFDAIASAALDAIASSTESSGSIARTESGSAGSEISWLSSSNSPVTNVEASAIGR
ncbi:hypothetical protein VTN00DRAFT_4782 [Thermoascus crustaceus]|uniref:uncharacterized protein n=1 Tax=Thermoascus crustaceus TaxID=5088 RepID=UPI003742E007